MAELLLLLRRRTARAPHHRINSMTWWIGSLLPIDYRTVWLVIRLPPSIRVLQGLLHSVDVQLFEGENVSVWYQQLTKRHRVDTQDDGHRDRGKPSILRDQAARKVALYPRTNRKKEVGWRYVLTTTVTSSRSSVQLISSLPVCSHLPAPHRIISSMSTIDLIKSISWTVHACLRTHVAHVLLCITDALSPKGLATSRLQTMNVF